MSFYNNFVKLCNNAGKAPSRVVLEIGGTKSAITRWKNGSNPTDATAMKIAEYFDVPVKELTGEESIGDILYEATRGKGLVDSPFKEQPRIVFNDDGISECKRKLIESVLDLPETQAELLLLLVEQQRKGRK